MHFWPGPLTPILRAPAALRGQGIDRRSDSVACAARPTRGPCGAQGRQQLDPAGLGRLGPLSASKLATSAPTTAEHGPPSLARTAGAGWRRLRSGDYRPSSTARAGPARCVPRRHQRRHDDIAHVPPATALERKSVCQHPAMLQERFWHTMRPTPRCGSWMPGGRLQSARHPGQRWRNIGHLSP